MPKDTLPWALQKWLNRFRCRLGCGLAWVQGSMCYMGCTLAPPGKYDSTVFVQMGRTKRWWCALMSDYFDHSLLLSSSYSYKMLDIFTVTCAYCYICLLMLCRFLQDIFFLRITRKRCMLLQLFYYFCLVLSYVDAFSALTLLVGRQEGGIRPVKTEWWGTGMAICLERGANYLHMVQLMPPPPNHLLLQ